MRRCRMCRQEIYTRKDKREMVRLWGMYNDKYDWRDKLHKCKGRGGD